MSIRHRMASYWAEIKYIASCGTFADKAALLKATVRHHSANWTRQGRDDNSLFKLNLGDGEVVMRSAGGDLSSFFEVIGERAYDIPAEYLDPATVRTIVDCGAHLGFSAIFFARKYPQARIVALEPNPTNFSLLCRNVAAFKRITPVQACVTGQSGTVMISTAGAGDSHRIVETGGLAVEGMTIAEICTRFGIETIDLLKMDIEGGEAEVFANGIDGNIRALVMELHRGIGYEYERFVRDAAPRTVSRAKALDIVWALPAT